MRTTLLIAFVGACLLSTSFVAGQLPSTCSGTQDCRTECPCQNNATCRAPDFTTCQCDLAKFTGKYCEVPICNRPKGCGAGKCVAPEVCDCTGTGFGGKYCTEPICTSPCQNGGKCVAPNSCECTGTGYTGLVCDVPICNAPIGCGPGRCVANETCTCDQGWTGKYCTTPICDPPCANGKCFGPNACDCSGTNHTGTLCETPVCEPLCEHGSVCSAPNTCDCSAAGPGWSGVICEVADCSANPCQNGGVCSSPGECNCANTGFQGLACEADEDECQRFNSPCYQGFQCVNEIGSYKCVGTCPSGLEGTGRLEDGGGCHTPTDCPTGYTGSLATSCVDINECTSSFNPCTPTSSCINTVGGYNCSTCQPGFAGTPCVDVNECLNATSCDPLTNCTNTLGSYQCSACPAGYTGDGKTGCRNGSQTTGTQTTGTQTTGSQTTGTQTTGVLPSPTMGPGRSTDADLSAASSNYSIWLVTFVAGTILVVLFM